jgi:hypothetical protein
MVDITFNGMTMEYDFVAMKMDPELKAELKQKLGNCDEQQLLDAYMEAHKEKFSKGFMQFD